MKTCSRKKTAKCGKPNVNRCHFQSYMCWEQPLNLLSIEAFTDYIVHYFRCVFFFCCFSLSLSFSPVVHFSSADGGFRFLICCYRCCCCCCCCYRVSPSLQCSSSAREFVCLACQPRKKNVIKKIIIRTASLKTMSNSIIFNSLLATGWRSLFLFFFLSFFCSNIFFLLLCNSKSAIDFRVASRLGVCYLIFADAYFSFSFFFSFAKSTIRREREREILVRKKQPFSPVRAHS